MRPALLRSVLSSVLFGALLVVAPCVIGLNDADAKPKKSVKEKKKPAEVKLPKGEELSANDSSADASGTPPPTRGPTRIDFDDRLIQGQTNKSGAVYLYDRKELKTRSMIKKRESFRDEIITSVYDG